MQTSNRPESSPFVLVSSPEMRMMGNSLECILREEYGVDFPHYPIEYTRFSNGEILPYIPETVRRQHVLFLHGLQQPDPNTALVKLLLVNDALTRASAEDITIVVPYIGYLRQDRKDKPRVPISARLVANLIEASGDIRSIITMDMHAEQEQGFFSVPVDNLTAASLFVGYLGERLRSAGRKVMAVAPDFGGVVRTRRFAKQFGDIPVAIIEKRRPNPNESEIISIIGESVEGAFVVIFEDMIDTGRTILGTARAMKSMGAAEIYLSATHGIFSGNAESEFSRADVKVFCTDSIPRSEEFRKRNPWLEVVSIDRMLAKAIFEASLVGGSVSKWNV